MREFAPKNLLMLTVALWAAVLCFAQNASDIQGLSTFPQSFFADPRPVGSDIFAKQVFLRDSTYTFRKDTTQGDWYVDSKRLFSYDKAGRQTESVRSISMEGVWVPVTRRKSEYGADERLSSLVISGWNAEAMAWVNQTERKYYYNYAGLENEIVTQIWESERWTLAELMERKYTNYNFPEEEVFFKWSNKQNNWKPAVRVLYIYLNNLLAQQTNQQWVDSMNVWVNDYTTLYSYDDDMKLIQTIVSDWDIAGSQFVQTTSTYHAYNDLGQVQATESVSILGNQEAKTDAQDVEYNSDGNLNEVVHSSWDEDLEMWVPFMKMKHYWSLYTIGNLTERPSEIACSFANPYTIGLPWFCESLKPDVTYTVDVYDQTGRHFYSDRFLGRHSFRISRNVPPGFYLVVIRGGLDVHTEKVIIRP